MAWSPLVLQRCGPFRVTSRRLSLTNPSPHVLQGNAHSSRRSIPDLASCMTYKFLRFWASNPVALICRYHHITSVNFKDDLATIYVAC